MTPPGVKESFVEALGTRLRLLDWDPDPDGPAGQAADGPLIFFVHANGYLAAMWHPIALELKAQGRVIGVDLPGHGDSEPAPDYRWDRLTEYVAEVLRKVDLGPALLVGHSVGGALSAMCAARYPELVRAMVLADPVILPEAFYHHPEASAKSDLYGASKRRRSWPSREAMRESLASKAAYSKWRPEMLDLYVQEGARETPEGITLKCAPETEAEIYRQTLGYNLWPEIAHADVPTVVLRGLSKERLLSVTAPELAGWLPQAKDRPLAEASHLLPMEFPEEVVSAITGLLSRA